MHSNSTVAYDFAGANALERALSKAISGEVRFDDGSRALYATDASNYRQVPIGVVCPRSIDEVIATVALCREHSAPLLCRGGGTSLCGQCCNAAVIIDFSKYLNRIISVDPTTRTARVEPGVVLDHLRDAAEKHHLTFAPDPSTHNHNTLGGMIGNNSCGVHSVMGGDTAHNVLELDVLTYDGTRMTLRPTDDAEYADIIRKGGRPAEIYSALRALAERYGAEIRKRFPQIPRRVSGYNLPTLLPENHFDVARAVVGSEGTCVVVLGATLRLVASPIARTLLVLGYKDVFAAADDVPNVMQQGPIGLEGIDDRLIADMKAVHLHPHDIQLLPSGSGWLLAEFGGATRDESRAKAQHAADALKTASGLSISNKIFDDPEEEKLIWEVRKSGLGATAHVPGKDITWEGWEDSSVPPENLGEYLRKLRALFDKYQYEGDLYGHFGQGCVHTRINFGLTSEAGIRKYREFVTEAAHLVVSLNGSISGEHGDGQSKAELLPIMFGEALTQAFHEFKRIWDPMWRMNPGKVVSAYRLDQNLRLGVKYRPIETQTKFLYVKDNGQFARTLLRCVGVGEWRKHHPCTMCPSYMATLEEKHATRGRARLLFEALQGDFLRDGWRDDSVHEALELCLSCKSCKSECPVNVDMATLKAEFMSHYYAGRLRPRQAYAFGLIDRWARLASHAPGIANFLMSHQPFTGAIKSVAGIASERSLPIFANRSFTATFSTQATTGRKVLLWPDTFNNYWHPDTLQAASRVLHDAGCDVRVPTGLCCGRPLYEFGMLDRAFAYLKNILDTLGSDIDAGTPLIVLEPACAAVFRDELKEWLPHDERAKRLSEQTFLLSEFIDRELPDYALPALSRETLVHAHCIHKAIMKTKAEEAVLKRIGLDGKILDAGCCGMAGSFGFDRRKYDVSMKIGERVLLPAVRSASNDTLIIANGYSCREQISQSTGRHALHLAQVLAMALEQRV